MLQHNILWRIYRDYFKIVFKYSFGPQICGNKITCQVSLGTFGMYTWINPSRTQVFLRLLKDMSKHIPYSSPGTTQVLLELTLVLKLNMSSLSTTYKVNNLFSAILLGKINSKEGKNSINT